MRKRPRSVNLKEASTDEDVSEGGSDSGMDEIVGKSASKPRPKGKGKAKAAEPTDQMDVDDTASVAGSVRSRGRPPKSKTQTPGSAAKRRVRLADSKVVPGTDGEDDDVQSVKSAPTASAQKWRGRPPKSKPVITDSDREMDVEDDDDYDGGSAAARNGGARARGRGRGRGRARRARDEDDDDWEAKGGTIRATQPSASATPSATSEPPSPARTHSRPRSESESDRGSRASMVCDVDDSFVEKCRAAEERHRSELKNWISAGHDVFVEPDRSYLYEIRALATRQY